MQADGSRQPQQTYLRRWTVLLSGVQTGTVGDVDHKGVMSKETQKVLEKLVSQHRETEGGLCSGVGSEGGDGRGWTGCECKEK